MRQLVALLAQCQRALGCLSCFSRREARHDAHNGYDQNQSEIFGHTECSYAWRWMLFQRRHLSRKMQKCQARPKVDLPITQSPVTGAGTSYFLLLSGGHSTQASSFGSCVGSTA